MSYSRCSVPGCALCYENRTGRANHKHHRGYSARGERFEATMAIRRQKARVEGLKELGLDVEQDTEFRDRWPTLYERLTLVRWEDGRARRPDALTLFVDAGVLKASLRDRDEGYVGFTSDRSILGLLDGLEEALASDEWDWQIDKYDKRWDKKGKG